MLFSQNLYATFPGRSARAAPSVKHPKNLELTCITAPITLHCNHACMHAKLLQLHPTLCNQMDYSLPGSSVHGVLQARIVEWGAIPSSRESSRPRDGTHVSCHSCIAGGFFIAEPQGNLHYNHMFHQKISS